MVLKSRLIKAANQVWESLNKKELEEEYSVATNSSFKGLAIISFVMLSVIWLMSSMEVTTRREEEITNILALFIGLSKSWVLFYSKSQILSQHGRVQRMGSGCQ